MSQSIQRSANPYDELPEGIKAAYSEQEYLWLSNEQKANLIQAECMPDVNE